MGGGGGGGVEGAGGRITLEFDTENWLSNSLPMS